MAREEEVAIFVGVVTLILQAIGVMYNRRFEMFQFIGRLAQNLRFWSSIMNLIHEVGPKG